VTSAPPEPPGPGLKWAEGETAFEEATEKILGRLALDLLRDADRDFRLSGAADWSRIEELVRERCRADWAALESRHAAKVGSLQ
jgi:hypothetical protein